MPKEEQEMSHPPVLYLDYDGVLHPDAVYVFRNRGIVLMRDGHSLFEGVCVLEEILSGYPAVRIVLSTRWVPALDFTRAKRRLSPTLQQRVIGATFHRRLMRLIEFRELPRGVQIVQDASRRGVTRWVAIDDDDERWPPQHRERLVLTDGNVGLLDADVQHALGEKLDELTRNHS